MPEQAERLKGGNHVVDCARKQILTARHEQWLRSLADNGDDRHLVGLGCRNADKLEVRKSRSPERDELSRNLAPEAVLEQLEEVTGQPVMSSRPSPR